MNNDKNATPSPQNTREISTPEETLDALLGDHKRKGPPIDYGFLQQRGGDRAPGPLRLFVEERQLFALQLYLLLNCLALAPPWDSTRPAGLWARALGKTNAGGEAAVSRAWKWLELNKLVTTARQNRMVQATLLAHNGTGRPYKRRSDFFILPNAFFLKGCHRNLKLPGTAMLLIALYQLRNQDEFVLSYANAARYYGLSEDTARRGIDELLQLKLLAVEPKWMKLPLSGHGGGDVPHYKLLDPLDRQKVIPGGEVPF